MVTIAWDVDDVLNDLMREWFQTQWKKTHPNCGVTFEDLLESPPHRILDIPPKNYFDSLDVYRRTAVYEQMVPNQTVMEWFIQHGRKYRHIALSAVPLLAADISAKWTILNFGKWIRTYHFVPSYRETCNIPSYDQSKKDFLQWIQKVDYLVDDNEDNIEQAESAGVKGILFPRPWNTARSQPIESIFTFLSSLV